MAKGLIAVTGATGHIGSVLAETLLKKGAKVRAVARHADKLAPLAQKGAETLAADLGDAQSLNKAFVGAETAFVLIPPNYTAQDFRAYQNHISTTVADTIKTTGVKYVVHLSSMGAHLSEGAGPVNGLHDSEERLNKLEGINVLHLRPSYFMENLLMNIQTIKGMGIAGSPLKRDVPIPVIATRDIADVAAKRILALDWKGKEVQELLGPRDYTMDEATRVIGEAIGKKDLKYVEFPYDEAQKAMVSMGLSPDLARLFNEMNRGFNEGKVKPTQARSPKTTTPTTLEDFARTVFAPAFKN